MKKKILITIPIIVMLSSCATPPEKIKASYVSPMQYNNYTCIQISEEIQRLSYRVNELKGLQQKTVSKNNTVGTVGLLLFWPALFFIEGDSEQANEYSRLKGEFNTIEQVGIQKNCNLQIYKPNK